MSNTNPNLSMNGCSWGERMKRDSIEIQCRYPYNNIEKGTGASTTGTIYGIYDVTGTSGNYVMGNYNNYSGYSTKYNSGFSGKNGDGTTTTGISFPSRRYYNLYTRAIGIKGDAITVEKTEDFYDATSRGFERLITSSYGEPWIMRGGWASNLSQTSIFDLKSSNGSNRVSTRFVMINY